MVYTYYIINLKLSLENSLIPSITVPSSPLMPQATKAARSGSGIAESGNNLSSHGV